MFTIALSRNPDASEVQRVMSVIGLIAGMEVMQNVTAALMQSGAVPPAPAPGPSPTAAFTPPPPPPQQQQAETAPKDSAGFPWDERIHSSAKSFNKDGSWKKKRGVQDTVVSSVEQQLRLTYPAPNPQGAFTPPAPPPPPPAPVGQVPPPPPPPPPAAPAQTGALDFIGLMGKITGHIAAGKITQADVAGVCQQFGIAAAPLLAQRPDLIPSVGATLDALALSRP